MSAVLDLQRFEIVIGRLLGHELGSGVAIRWAHQPFPRPPFPFVELRYLTAPSSGLPHNHVQTLPTLVRVTFEAASNRERVLDVNAARYRTDVDGLTASRDAMLEALVETFDDVAAIGVGETEIEIFPTSTGGLWRVQTPSPGLSAVTVSTGNFAVKTASCRVTVAVDVHGKAGRRPTPAELLEQVMVGLDEPDARNTMAAHRIGFSAPASSGARDLSEIEGVDHELRAQRDLEFWVESRRVSEFTPIERVEIGRGSAG